MVRNHERVLMSLPLKLVVHNTPNISKKKKKNSKHKEAPSTGAQCTWGDLPWLQNPGSQDPQGYLALLFAFLRQLLPRVFLLAWWNMSHIRTQFMSTLWLDICFPIPHQGMEGNTGHTYRKQGSNSHRLWAAAFGIYSVNTTENQPLNHSWSEMSQDGSTKTKGLLGSLHLDSTIQH